MSHRFFPALLLVVLTLAANGCARLAFKPEPVVSPAAAELLDRVQAVNSGLTACKGLGTIDFQNQPHTPRARFAWLCRPPDKIRLEVLAPTGTPLFTLASDGVYVYALSRTGDKKLFKKKAAGLDLHKIISLPLTIGDIACLLSGGIPLRGFDTAERLDPPGGGHLLQLKSRRPDRAQNIAFDPTTGHPSGITFLRGSGPELEYAVALIGVRETDGQLMPEAIRMENDRHESVIIAIDRFWSATNVPDEKFTLTAPPD